MSADSAPKYYDWAQTLAYDADVTMVIGARGIGKTFGLRKQCINDYIRRGYRFVEIVRYKNELSDVADGYFDRLAELEDFNNYVFKTDSKKMYIAAKPEKDKKPEWELLGYFVALTEEQKKKKKTHHRVRRMIFDEALLDRTDRFHHYLPNEWLKLARLVSTYSRERADTEGIKPRLYLLGNAIDISNPYFAIHKVKIPIEYGYRWYSNKTFLLHVAEDEKFSRQQRENTVAGRMLDIIGNTTDSDNVFEGQKEEFIKQKPKSAKFQYGIAFNNYKFGIWIDFKQGYFHVTNKIPNNNDNVYYLQHEDESVNWMGATRSMPVMKQLVEGYYFSVIRYENLEVKIRFYDLLKYFGVS